MSRDARREQTIGGSLYLDMCGLEHMFFGIRNVALLT